MINYTMILSETRRI